MNKSILWMMVVLMAAATGVITYYGLQKMRPQPRYQSAPPAAEPARQAAPPADAAPEIRYPVRSEGTPLPPLNESDADLRAAIHALLGDKSLEALLNPQELVRRVVATVDSLPRAKVPQRMMPVKPVGGPLVATGGDEGVISRDNAARYARYVAGFEALDAKKLVAVYARFYPLFQQAYREMGYPNGYFNDRLVEAIDSLLATPGAAEPVRVVRPKVLYEYAEPQLESLPAGQKVLVRIGAANAAKVKKKLMEIRTELLKAGQKG